MLITISVRVMRYSLADVKGSLMKAANLKEKNMADTSVDSSSLAGETWGKRIDT